MKHLPYLRKHFGNFFLISLFTGISSLGFSQQVKQGSLEYLQLCKGFKEITLGADADLIPAYKLAFLDGDTIPDADSCFKFEYKDEDILKWGDSLFLDLVGIRTYKNKIVNIYLFFKREDGYEILRDFIDDYGQPGRKTGDFIYDWETNVVNLSLRYKPNIYDLGVAIYSFNSLEYKLSLKRLNNNSTIAKLIY